MLLFLLFIFFPQMAIKFQTIFIFVSRGIANWNLKDSSTENENVHAFLTLMSFQTWLTEKKSQI